MGSNITILSYIYYNILGIDFVSCTILEITFIIYINFKLNKEMIDSIFVDNFNEMNK